MARDDDISIKGAVHKLQLSLLEGIQSENQLFAVGSLMSRGDYGDVVTERSIAKMCGYPLCSNSLPTERPHKGHYRISLKEHKVYDLNETYLFCSTSCVINSRAFAGSLDEERCSNLNSAKINKIMKLFEGLSLDPESELGQNGDLGFSALKIQEKAETRDGEVSFEEWIGPSNAIEGYVPQKDLKCKPSNSRKSQEESKFNRAKMNKANNLAFDEMDFKSIIMTQDEYSVSKTSSVPPTVVSSTKNKEPKRKTKVKKMDDNSLHSGRKSKSKKLKEKDNVNDRKDKISITDVSSFSCQKASDIKAAEEKSNSNVEKAAHLSATMLKPSLKTATSQKLSRSVTWADEKVDEADNRKLCEVRSFDDSKESARRDRSVDKRGSDKSLRIGSAEACAVALSQAAEVVASGESDASDANKRGSDKSLRIGSAEACAVALSQAAEVVASGESDASDALSEAGIIILPPAQDANEAESQDIVDVAELEPTPLKWPQKPGTPNYEIFDSEDSWYDGPPEGFSLTLSPFGTMWMAFFSWISSSSLAYIYGRDESLHEEYLSINGRAYPRKSVCADGLSSEIKQTFAGCLSRALPGVVAELRLSTPISTLEQGMGGLLDTMSFIDPLPSFKMRQWQVIILLFIDALSVSRIPSLTPHLADRRPLFRRIIDRGQMSAEEYEIMKDLVLPLGRAAEFSPRKGA